MNKSKQILTLKYSENPEGEKEYKEYIQTVIETCKDGDMDRLERIGLIRVQYQEDGEAIARVLTQEEFTQFNNTAIDEESSISRSI